MFMSPRSSPFVPCMSVLLSHSASVTDDEPYMRSQQNRGLRRRTGTHGHAGSHAAFILDVHHLMIHHVIVAVVHTSAIWSSPERFRDIFNIQHVGIHYMLCPLHVSP